MIKKSFWFIVSTIFLVALQQNLIAAVTDWRDPGAYGDCSATGWTNPGYACDGINDTWAAMPAYDPMGPSTNECFYNFGFTIPAESTIDGIEIAVYCKPATEGGWVTSVFRLAWEGCPECTWSTCTCDGTECVQKSENVQMTMDPDLYVTPGGSTDTWGRTWSLADLSDANFRLAIQSTTTTQALLVDSVKIRVWYTPPPTPTPTNPVCNPGFETPTPVCWDKDVTESDAPSKIDLNNTVRAHSGSKSCRYDDPTTNYFARDIRSNYISVTPGDTWDFACYYYLNQDSPGSSASDTHVRFRIEWWDINGYALTPNWYPPGDTGINCADFGNWNAINYSDVTIPEGADTMTLRAFCREDVNNNNDLWLDDFSAIKQED